MLHSERPFFSAPPKTTIPFLLNNFDTPLSHCQRHIYVYTFVSHQIYTSTLLLCPANNRARWCLLLRLVVAGSAEVH
jgi:hypothetical protein